MDTTKNFIHSSRAIIDREILQELIDMDNEDHAFVLELIDLYINSSVGRMQNMKQALTTKDISKIGVLAHGLKSSSGHLGLKRVCWIVQKIETMPNNELTAELESLVQHLEKEILDALDQLQIEKRNLLRYI